MGLFCLLLSLVCVVTSSCNDCCEIHSLDFGFREFMSEFENNSNSLSIMVYRLCQAPFVKTKC